MILSQSDILIDLKLKNFGKSIGGRLPTFEEWKLAAYTQLLKSDKFVKGQTYVYPSGDKAEGLNAQGVLNYNKHVNVTSLPEGINGLVAWVEMSGNGLIIKKKKKSLTAGSSWWYGAYKTQVSEVQYKPSDFMLFISVSGVFMIKKKLKS